MKKTLLGTLCLFAVSAFASVSVQVSAPTANSTVSSPIHVKASASSSHPIVGWHVYLDSKDVYDGPATSSIDTNITAAKGTHQLVIKAWDSTGALGSKTIQTTVSGTTTTTGVTVNVASPLVNSTGASPLAISASAASSHPIVGWHVYLDGKDVYDGGATTSITTAVSAAAGTHSLVIRAWDSTGVFGDKTLTTTIASTTTTPPPPASNGLPTPPSTAKVFTNNEEGTTGWGNCGTAACAGGSGSGSYWQAFNQTTPSMDGRSMELYRDGVWANALWWRHLGANNSATNFLWDFWVQVDSKAATASQTLEYDVFQFVGGYNYMIGTQCNYAAKVWDTWNEYTGHWLHTTIPCPKFTAGEWHHIQWYVTTNHTDHTYTYKTLVVDGTAYTVNQTQPAKNLGWADNMGVQWQLDVNATGSGYHEWVDKSTLTVW